MKLLELLRWLANYLDSSPEWSFAKNTVKRVFVFTLIALSAVGLNSIVEMLNAAGAPALLTYSLSVAEFLLVVADVLWFVKPLLLEIADTLKSIFRGAPVFISLLLVAIVLWGASTPATLAYFKDLTTSLVLYAKTAAGMP
jgi:hypothetical protein